MKIYITEAQFKELIEDSNQTKVYNGIAGNSLSYDEQNELYDMFRSSYMNSVGNSWNKDKFLSRLQDWVLFGDSHGFIAVRHQASNMIKLTGSAGAPKSIYNGLQMLNNIHKPIWGVVTPNIASIMKKRGFIIPNKFIIETIFKLIPRSVFGNSNLELNDDGSLTVTSSDIGTINKYFVANKEYFKNLVNLPNVGDKIPNLVKIWINKL